MMCASASLAVEMWLMFVTRPRFLNVVRMESLNESYACDSPVGKAARSANVTNCLAVSGCVRAMVMPQGSVPTGVHVQFGAS